MILDLILTLVIIRIINFVLYMQVKLKECLCRLESEMDARRAMEDELCQEMKLTGLRILTVLFLGYMDLQSL